MSTRIVPCYAVQCDVCAMIGPPTVLSPDQASQLPDHVAETGKRYARANAESRGWSVHAIRDICPSCKRRPGGASPTGAPL